MSNSEIAKKLGRAGGLKRAARLSKQRRREIASLGAVARTESFRLTKTIRNNFDYLAAIQQLHTPQPVVSQAADSGKLPGIYEKKHQA